MPLIMSTIDESQNDTFFEPSTGNQIRLKIPRSALMIKPLSTEGVHALGISLGSLMIVMRDDAGELKSYNKLAFFATEYYASLIYPVPALLREVFELLTTEEAFSETPLGPWRFALKVFDELIDGNIDAVISRLLSEALISGDDVTTLPFLAKPMLDDGSPVTEDTWFRYTYEDIDK